MIADMYNLGKAFVDSGGDFGRVPLSEHQKRVAFLCEPQQVGTPLFVLWLDKDGVARLEQQEVQAGQSYRFPFVKVAPRAAYLTPVFKCEVKKGIQASKRRTTRNHFESLAQQSLSQGNYFHRVVDVLSAQQFRVSGESDVSTVEDAFLATVEHIVSLRLSGRSPLICVAVDEKGEVWPGDDEQFVEWILGARERLSIYETKDVPNCENGICPFTGEKGELFPNALSGAGLNFVNGDYEGSFSELNSDRAWQRSGISAAAADILYIYKNHVAPGFFEYIAGSKSLVIPAASAGKQARERFIQDVQNLIRQGHDERTEQRLLDKLADNEGSVASVSLLWASFGQKFEEATGIITHVLPSRLSELTSIQKEYNNSTHPLYPQHNDKLVRRNLDLRLGLVADLIYRPGGARVKDENSSPRRHAVLRQLAAAIFHKQPLDASAFWKQISQTARAYVVLLLEQSDNSGVSYQLRIEGPKVPKKQTPLTVNGWIRHLTMFLSHLADPRIGVFPKEDYVYEPNEESLRPLLAQAKGLDNNEKAFAFLLGVLYGHLIYVQADKAKVSVASNSLSWLRSGRVRASDLPGLYSKVTSKLLEYHSLGVARKYRRLHEIEAEAAHLGTIVGSEPSSRNLPDDKVLYFLMLGMAMAYKFTATEKNDDSKTSQSNKTGDNV